MNYFSHHIHSGIDEIDYSRYPTKEFQLNWLRCYLETYREDILNNPITEQDVHQLYVQVNAFALASHFFWTIWALIQAEHSSIDFDYVS